MNKATLQCSSGYSKGKRVTLSRLHLYNMIKWSSLHNQNHLQEMLKYSPDYNNFENYLETTKLDSETRWNYNSWVSALGRDQDWGYHQAMNQVVQWTQTHHDEVLECLLCLMIFFSQTDSEAIEGFSENIDMIQQSWR